MSTILLLLLGLHCVDLRGLSAQSSNASSSLGDAGGGSWELLLQNAGIASMHTALTHFGTLVLLDRTDIGASLLNLPDGTCRNDPLDLMLKHDCSAHSVLYDPSTNTVRPLTILTDTWCSSGQFMPDGTLLQTGGDYDGATKIRTFTPCDPSGTCDWVESSTQFLQEARWYATNQLLPEGQQIIIGGRRAFNYEFLPFSSLGLVNFTLLAATNDPEEDNLYPFVHLLPDGTLFIFANRDSIVLDYNTNTVLKTLPTIPGEPRNYPSAGSSVLLPLLSANQFLTAEILVCGGAQYGAYLNPSQQLLCSSTCGRIMVTDAAPMWSMETMPINRCMGDMIILPSQDILIINGAQQGSQGWGDASNPAFTPVLYSPYATVGFRFTTLTPGTIPRMYHSTANLLPDGRIFLAGSNPHQFYSFNVEFPTELRLEAFSPPYLNDTQSVMKPTIVAAPQQVNYGAPLTILITTPVVLTGLIEVNLVSSPFVTHSFAQGQRLLSLDSSGPVQTAANTYEITATAPLTPMIAPPSYYMLFAVNQGIPSIAAWVQLLAPI